jgi:hypothetical protein
MIEPGQQRVGPRQGLVVVADDQQRVQQFDLQFEAVRCQRRQVLQFLDLATCGLGDVELGAVGIHQCVEALVAAQLDQFHRAIDARDGGARGLGLAAFDLHQRQLVPEAAAAKPAPVPVGIEQGLQQFKSH